MLIDPKRCEFDKYIPLYDKFFAKLTIESDAIVYDSIDCLDVLESLITLMNNRYDKLKEADARNVQEYNKRNPEEPMPYIVTVIDEFADLMMMLGREFESKLSHLAALSRAVGMHFVICTQRPTTNIISGWIKANFPARIAFRVSLDIDSLTILDHRGAECLNGNGDMLAKIDSFDPVRIQGAYIEDDEIQNVVSFIARQ